MVAYDNPGGNFPTNSRLSFQNGAQQTSASLANLFSPTPTLAHRDKKINLNFPLPVSNDPNEPVRQKWITDTYYLLKLILPPRAVDTPEELAQLSQFVINIIDFRDPDGTMTHWVNPDVYIAGINNTMAAVTAATPAPALAPIPATGIPANGIALDQYGMEYSPVAINEVLAYSYLYWTAAGGNGAGGNNRANRFFIELVNTLNSPELSPTLVMANSWNPALGLGGFQSWQTDPTTGKPDPYASGCWDIVFTTDDPYSRPDPYRGQLLPYGNAFGLTPLSHTSFDNSQNIMGNTAGTTALGAGVATSDVALMPLGYPPSATVNITVPPPGIPTPSATSDYFYAFGNQNPQFPPSLTAPVPSPDNAPFTATTWTWPLSAFPSVMTDVQTNSGYTVPSGYINPPSGTAGGATTAPTLSQTLSTAMDPFNGSNAAPATTSPMPLYLPGVLPVQPPPNAQSSGGNNPSITTPLPPNYSTYLNANTANNGGNANNNVPNQNPFIVTAAGGTTGGGAYYWVCLRRPANPFAPVSALNPMVVVDSMRFPFIEATAPFPGNPGPGANGGVGPATLPNLPGPITTVSPTTTGTAGNAPAAPPAVGPTLFINLPPSLGGGTALPATTAGVPFAFSAQRFQPYRGGHAVPNPILIAGNPNAIDPRYGYTEQTLPPSFWGLGTLGIYYMTSVTNNANNPAGNPTATTTATIYPATNPIYHTIGWANEYEQGAPGTLVGGVFPNVEPWNYFVFNDRDFTSVAELMLVPGSPPGLFTKQFVEFAPSWNNVANIFSTVQPQTTPLYTTQPSVLTTLPPPAAIPPALTPPPVTAVQPYQSASTPLALQYGIYQVAGTPLAADPRQPETYPYLIDKFFYTGYGLGNTVDALNSTVGGYAADGWFKMFDFFEVPSQSYGAIGQVAATSTTNLLANGTNFDWSRQDSKPGLLNLNLIIDEEVFFSVAGSQVVNQANGQYQTVANVGPTPPPPQTPTVVNQVPSDQCAQQLLNFDQLANWAPPNANGTINTGGVPLTVYVAPLNPGTAPIPLVVTASLGSGAPAYAYPMASYPFGTGGTSLLAGYPINGLLAADPTYNFSLGALVLPVNPTTMAAQPPPQYSNALKAAFAQFLTLRHGGSGYVFGFGSGPVGSYVSVATTAAGGVGPVIPGYNQSPSAVPGALPADRPFHSLSYPDIDYTVMRPAALPPSLSSYLGINPTTAALIVPNSGAFANGNFNPSSYSPPATSPLWTTGLFVGDPGVRNYWLFSGYPTETYPGTPLAGGAAAAPRTGRSTRRRSRRAGCSRFPTVTGAASPRRAPQRSSCCRPRPAPPRQHRCRATPASSATRPST